MAAFATRSKEERVSKKERVSYDIFHDLISTDVLFPDFTSLPNSW